MRIYNEFAQLPSETKDYPQKLREKRKDKIKIYNHEYYKLHRGMIVKKPNKVIREKREAELRKRELV